MYLLYLNQRMDRVWIRLTLCNSRKLSAKLYTQMFCGWAINKIIKLRKMRKITEKKVKKFGKLRNAQFVCCSHCLVWKGYFHSTISMQSFRIGFLRPKQNNARTGRSGCALPPRRTGLFGAACVVDCPAPAIAVAVVDGAGPPIPPMVRVSMPPLAVPL